MQIIKFTIVALLVCFFAAAVFGQGSRGGQDYETAASLTDDINEYHYNEIRQAVADHCNQRRGGKDIDVDININKLEIEFEKNFFIVIKKGGLVSK